jgi:hypothetical protein
MKSNGIGSRVYKNIEYKNQEVMKTTIVPLDCSEESSIINQNIL